jgi:hypothetical protein
MQTVIQGEFLKFDPVKLSIRKGKTGNQGNKAQENSFLFHKSMFLIEGQK